MNIAETETFLTRNRIFCERARGIGVLPKEIAIDLGVTGPCLRGSGVDWDIRKVHPYSSYEDFEFEVPVGAVGDNVQAAFGRDNPAVRKRSTVASAT